MHDTLIFDFDGTLIDSAPGILATFAEVLDAAGITPAVPLDHRLIGPPLAPTMAKLIGRDDPELLAHLVEDFKPRYAITGIAHTPAYPDADRTLHALREAGKTLYLATNKRASPTLALIDKFGWQQHFRRIYCLDSQQPPYADKATMLGHLLKDNHLRPTQCVYIGDTRGDYLAANGCDISFIAAKWGYEDWLALPDEEIMLKHSCAILSALGNTIATLT